MYTITTYVRVVLWDSSEIFLIQLTWGPVNHEILVQKASILCPQLPFSPLPDFPATWVIRAGSVEGMNLPNVLFFLWKPGSSELGPCLISTTSLWV